LLAALSTHASAWLRNGYEEQFIPHPTTWLSEGRWEDDPPGPRTNGTPTRQQQNRAAIEASLARMEGRT
jgi:hypothetical protein